MTRNVKIVRLLAAVVISLAACQFVAMYNGLSYARFKVDHGQEISYSSATLFMKQAESRVFGVPIVAFLAGGLLIWRRPEWHARFEVIVSSLWVLSFFWTGLSLICWQVQNIPIVTGLRVHY